MTPAKHSGRGGQHASSDDDDHHEIQHDDNDVPSPDEELELFLRSAPTTADHVVVVASSHTGENVVQDRTMAEAKRAPVQLAKSISAACARWAEAEGRVTKFRATWMRDERVLSAHQWQAGEGRDPTRLDGTVESFLIQQQRSSADKDRLNLEAHQMLQEGWKQLLGLANKQISSQQLELADLRDRLRKADDVGSEMALEQMRSDLEQRGRTSDLIEKRLMPVLQALALKQVERQEASEAAAIVEKTS